MYKSFQSDALMQRMIIGALLSLTLWLSACSAMRLGYNQAPSLSYWWIDGYADLSDPQSVKTREDLADWWAWHRRTQLPDYATLLARARGEILQPVTAAQVCRWYDDVNQRVQTAIDHALPAITDLVLSLTPEQIAHMERQFAKGQAKATQDHLQPDPDDRLQAAVNRAADRVRWLYGEVNEAQRTRLVSGVTAAPIPPTLWLQERQARQQDLLRLLRQWQAAGASDTRPTPPQAQAYLRQWLDGWQRSPREAYRLLQQRAVAYNCQWAADLHNLSTPAQRQTAAERLQGWAEDAKVLGAP